jgi:hypothetical protein
MVGFGVASTQPSSDFSMWTDGTGVPVKAVVKNDWMTDPISGGDGTTVVEAALRPMVVVAGSPSNPGGWVASRCGLNCRDCVLISTSGSDQDDSVGAGSPVAGVVWLLDGTMAIYQYNFCGWQIADKSDLNKSSRNSTYSLEPQMLKHMWPGLSPAVHIEVASYLITQQQNDQKQELKAKNGKKNWKEYAHRNPKSFDLDP